MSNPFTLENKTILITGASSGIGRACAIECSKIGAQVIITGRNMQRLSETFQLLSGDGHLSICADLKKDSDLINLIETIEKIDGVVLNAGINDKCLIKNLDREEIDKIMSTNFSAPVHLVQLLLKKKKMKKQASIIFMSSISAFYPTISNGMYASSKAALNAFAKVLALEVLPQKIRVNCIQPAFVETEMLQKYVLQDEIIKIRENYPLGRFARPEEIAYAVIYYLSDASQWVTGTFFTMDGGFTLR